MPLAEENREGVGGHSQVSQLEISPSHPPQLTHDPHLVRWNFGALLVDVSCFAIGMAFLDFSAVLPVLMERLGANGLLIGMFAAVRFLAFSGVQMFVAYGTYGLPRQKPTLTLVATITRLPLLLMPYFLSHAADSIDARNTALWSTIIILSIWALGDGLGYVPWMEIVAKSFSDRTRGRFFATTQTLSGLIGMAIAAFCVRPLLEANWLRFPFNYALLAGICAVMLQISLVGIYAIREPAPPASSPVRANRPPLTTYFRRLPGLIRGNPIFARLSAIQLLIGFGNAASPFYVIYAREHFRLGDQWAAIYQVMLAVGMMVLMPVLAWLSERKSPAHGVRGVAFACLLTPVVALTVGSLSPQAFCLVFLLMGGSLGWGMWIVLNQFLLTHVAADERPIYVALINLLYAPSAIYPVIGGLFVPRNRLLTWNGMPVLFLLTTLVIAVGFLLTLHLPEPNEERNP